MRSLSLPLSKRSRLLKRLRSPRDVALFVRVFVFAAAVPLLMRLPLHRVERIVEPGDVAMPSDPVRQAKVVRYTELAMDLGRPLVRRKCLTRGLTRYFFLRRMGVDVALAFGINHTEAKTTAHCWLVKDGSPYLEPSDPTPSHVEMYRLQPRRQHAIAGS